MYGSNFYESDVILRVSENRNEKSKRAKQKSVESQKVIQGLYDMTI